MKVSFEGIGEMVATFPVDGSVQKGQVVKLTAAGKASPCAAGEEFCGIAVNVRGDFAGVQFAGLTQVSYSGDTAPGCGWVRLSADGNGGVAPVEEPDDDETETAAAQGREFLVAAVDTAAKTAVVRL